MDVALRFPEPADAEAILAAVRESMAELHHWMAWCDPGFSLSDAARWVAEQPAARQAASAFEFVILDARGRLLGCCGLNQVNRSYRIANLGYWVRSSETGRGIATQAAKQAAAWAFASTDLQRLEIVAAVDNAASQAVAVKAGALREGVLRSRLLIHERFHDAVMFSLIRPGAVAS